MAKVITNNNEVPVGLVGHADNVVVGKMHPHDTVPKRQRLPDGLLAGAGAAKALSWITTNKSKDLQKAMLGATLHVLSDRCADDGVFLRAAEQVVVPNDPFVAGPGLDFLVVETMYTRPFKGAPVGTLRAIADKFKETAAAEHVATNFADGVKELLSKDDHPDPIPGLTVRTRKTADKMATKRRAGAALDAFTGMECDEPIDRFGEGAAMSRIECGHGPNRIPPASPPCVPLAPHSQRTPHAIALHNHRAADVTPAHLPQPKPLTVACGPQIQQSRHGSSSFWHPNWCDHRVPCSGENRQLASLHQNKRF